MNALHLALLVILQIVSVHQWLLLDLKIHMDALHDLVPFVQFKKREKHRWWSVTFSKVAGFSLQLF